MYFYLYDAFLQDKKYSKLLADIEARFIDLSIQGRVSRLNILNDMREMVIDAVKRGAETVVVVGDDRTVGRAINAIVNLNVTLGIIPVGSGHHIFAQHLGIPVGLPACEVLSKRIKESIDAAHVNGNYFVFYLKALSPDIKIIDSEGNYAITPMSANAEIFVCNFKPPEFSIEALPASFFIPHDGRLELVVHTKEQKSLMNKLFFKSGKEVGDYTIVPFRKIRLEPAHKNADAKLVLDGDRIIKPPVTVEVAPQKVVVIVGRERMF